LMPTGTGKSVVIGGFLHRIFSHFFNQKVLVLTHVKELIGQNHAKLKMLWPGAPAGINSAGLKQRDTKNPIIFAGIGSVAKHAKTFGHIDIVFIDEADLVSDSETTAYRKFLAELYKINPYLVVIGLTATPWRSGMGHLKQGGIFTDVAFDITDMESFNRLLAEGYLSYLVPRPTKQVLDVSGVHLLGGEFKLNELNLAVDKDEVTWACLQETAMLAEDRKHWLIFASGVRHALKIGQMLTYMGISNVVIHSDMGDSERDKGLALYTSGQVQVAVNNNVLTTGFDYPLIDLIVCLRPTMSSRLWVQMLGRGTRPVYAPGFDLDTIEGRLAAIATGPKQDCLVLDFARNTRRLGPINDPMIPRAKGKGGPVGEAPVKECPICETYNHTKAIKCTKCGHAFTFAEKLNIGASEDVLIKNVEPIIEVFKVDHVAYTKVQKLPNPTAMKVTYYCGVRRFSEVVCFEHEGFAGRKAVQWWNERAPDSVFPHTTDFGMAVADQLPHAQFIRVWVNQKHPQIMAHTFSVDGF
jgi:DNA repair protein RadD